MIYMFWEYTLKKLLRKVSLNCSSKNIVDDLAQPETALEGYPTNTYLSNSTEW